MSEHEAQPTPATPSTSTENASQETITATERQWIFASLGSALVLAIVLFGAYRMS